MATVTWKIRIHGHKHRVSCKLDMNKYIIFVDDDHLTNIYRDSMKKMRLGFERTLRICGQDCLFVVWDERPDLVVDGIMQGRGAPYLEAKEKRRRAWILAYRLVRWISVLAFTVLMVVLLRVPMETDVMAECISACTSLCFLFFWSGYKIRRWREW